METAGNADSEIDPFHAIVLHHNARSAATSTQA